MVRTRVGYTGGTLEAPTYRHLGDHIESLQVDYDPERTSYGELLALFWASHRPGRAAHRRQYMAAVFTADEAQRRLALESRARVAELLGQQVHTQVLPLERFYRAEDSHQKYHLRRSPELLQEFGPAYGPRQLVDSTVAARLNGYLAGYGSPEQLAAEVDRFGLSARGRQRLEAAVRSAARTPAPSSTGQWLP